MAASQRHLLILGCSQTKRDTQPPIAAIERYDGSMYRVLRSYLRAHEWPSNLSVAVLSAKYGLVGGLSPIRNYDLRMNARRAAALAADATATLLEWSKTHPRVSVSAGRDYLGALAINRINGTATQVEVFEGGIGYKLQRIRQLLHGLGTVPRKRVEALRRPCYFLPDWDDTLDPQFDFINDAFSGESKEARGDVHCCKIMQPHRMCDGILVSLAQHVTSRGALRRFEATEPESLSPRSMRARFHLQEDQALFGDCGAFSYVNEATPAIEVDEAVMLYQLHGFDYGASVDHIPVFHVFRQGKRVALSPHERAARVRLTKQNAQRFIDAWRRMHCTFAPVGTVQATSAESYGCQIGEYAEMGYEHIAIGGLVPLPDAEILRVAEEVSAAADRLRWRPWIHLFGVFRPRLQERLRTLRIDSFDSATYFRKAWLRSDQNYLAADGSWYAAIRVPMTSDARTQNRLGATRRQLAALRRLERQALQALHHYDAGILGIDAALHAVMTYDLKLSRSADHGANLEADYRRTLEARPWRRCRCAVCQGIGIDALIFRGSNRNKRRGAHNTLMLYNMLAASATTVVP